MNSKTLVRAEQMNDFSHRNPAARKGDKKHAPSILKPLHFYQQLIPNSFRSTTRTYQANEFKGTHSSLPSKPSAGPAKADKKHTKPDNARNLDRGETSKGDGS